MEKKKIDTKALLAQSRAAKVKTPFKNFDKVVGKAKNTAECRRVNFNK